MLNFTIGAGLIAALSLYLLCEHGTDKNAWGEKRLKRLFVLVVTNLIFCAMVTTLFFIRAPLWLIVLYPFVFLVYLVEMVRQFYLLSVYFTKKS